MRVFAWIVLAAVFSAGAWGCGPKGARLQKSVVPPDRTLFETGSEYLRKNQYLKARLAFHTLINTYPESELSADSYLAIGDSYYDQGGGESLIQAEDQYKNFIIFFPMNPKAADAQMKIIALNMKMMRTPDRDPTPSLKAEAAARQFMQQFPDSDYVPIVKEYLAEIQENLAMSSFGVGRFYEEKGNAMAAKSRYEEIAEKYDGFSLMDETYFRLAEVLERQKKPDEASAYYGRIAQGFPSSKFFEVAKQRLSDLGKPLPPVDAQVAARHEPRRKEGEGFSPLKPLIDFAEALGIKQTPDRYELAKKEVEARKADAAGAASKPDEAEKAADDILIQTTLRKDASGKTQETTVLGEAGPNAGKNKKNQPPD